MHVQAFFERHPDKCKQASCLLPTYVARKQLLPKLAAEDEPSAIPEGPTLVEGVSTHLVQCHVSTDVAEWLLQNG